MKNLFSHLVTVLVLSATLLIAGCGGAAKTKLDTTELVAAFASADAALKSQVDAAAKTLNSGKLLEGTSALVPFTKASQENLSEEQKTALLNLVAQVQTIITEDASKGDPAIFQATQDLVAAVEGRESTKVGVTPDMLQAAPTPAAE
jgi:outer membrane murein-binding lipoprotein Lpp